MNTVLFGIHWDFIPEKVAELRQINLDGKVVEPEGLTWIEEYSWGNKALEIVEADDYRTVMTYTLQFMPYTRNVVVTALIKTSEQLS